MMERKRPTLLTLLLGTGTLAAWFLFRYQRTAKRLLWSAFHYRRALKHALVILGSLALARPGESNKSATTIEAVREELSRAYRQYGQGLRQDWDELEEAFRTLARDIREKGSETADASLKRLRELLSERIGNENDDRRSDSSG